MTPALPLPPDVAERFTDVVLAGDGSEARVYRAVQRDTGRPVALKVFRVGSRAFFRELSVGGSVFHPNILSMQEFFHDAQHPTIVWEYCAGGSLRDRMEVGYTMAAREVLDLGLQVAGALGALHAANVIHGDLKPENILRKRRVGDPQWKVSDFGISANAFPATKALFSTPAYAAPELRIGRRSFASDVFALGRVLLETLELVEQPGDEIRSYLQTLVAESPEDRPSAAEVSQAIDGLIVRLRASAYFRLPGVGPLDPIFL